MSLFRKPSGPRMELFRGEPTPTRSTSHQIDIVCSAYRRPGELRLFVQCLLNQTDINWNLHIVHDGPDDDFQGIAEDFAKLQPKVRFTATPVRYNDYGYTPKMLGLRAGSGDYALLTNHDNYYPPRSFEFINAAISACAPDVVLFDMIHSHTNPGGRSQLSHCLFETQYSRLNIDMGSAVVRGDLARASDFGDRTRDSDATYFENVAAVAKRPLHIVKIPRVLLYHN